MRFDQESSVNSEGLRWGTPAPSTPVMELVLKLSSSLTALKLGLEEAAVRPLLVLDGVLGIPGSLSSSTLFDKVEAVLEIADLRLE